MALPDKLPPLHVAVVLGQRLATDAVQSLDAPKGLR
jgi:hypothetical protein